MQLEHGRNYGFYMDGYSGSQMQLEHGRNYVLGM